MKGKSSDKNRPPDKHRAKKIVTPVTREQDQPALSPESAIDQAAQLLAENRFPQVVEVLAPFAAYVTSVGTELLRLYLSLLSLGYAHCGKLSDAESTAQQLVELEPKSCDGWYALTFVHLSMREYEKAETAAQRYLASLPAKKTKSRSFCTQSGHQSQLVNMLATAFRERGRLREAEQQFHEAIKLDPGNHLPYLNLVNLLRKQGRQADARQIIAEGLRSVRQIHELRMLDMSGSPRATISACMIVKNEEALLGDCLASIRDWVDEIIIVDTGSTDRTVEIAKSYGARVFHQAWEGNFSKPRNYSLAQATGDWIFVIDADERMFPEDVPLLERLVNDKNIEAISVNVYNVYGDNESTVTFLPSTRLFRRSLGLYYDGIVHNTLVHAESQPIVRAGIRLKHLGYGLDKETMRRKLERSRVLLEKQLAEDPDNAFALFNYAQLLRGDVLPSSPTTTELILKSARRAVELTNPDTPSERHLHLMCLDQIAWTLFKQGEFQDAEVHAQKALSLKSNYLDPMILLAHISARQQKYEEARRRYTAYLKAQAKYDPSKEIDNVIMLHVDSRVSAWYSLGMIAELEGKPEQARHYYEQVIQKDRSYLDTNAHLGRLASQKQDFAVAAEWYRKHISAHPESIMGYRELGQVRLALGIPEQAAESFKLGLALDSRDTICLIGLGRAHGALGEYTQAVQYLKSAVETSPGNDTVTRELASFLFLDGQFAEAAKVYADILGRVEYDPELLNDLGNCRFKLEQYDLAADAYRSALKSPEHEPSVWRNLGLAQLMAADFEGSMQSFLAYLERNPGDHEVLSLVADIHFQSGNYDRALAAYERYLSLLPADPQAIFALSECYLNMGYGESAIIGYRRVLTLAPAFLPAQERLASLSASVPAG